MSYLKFDKSLMINLEQSLPKEILRTNKSGAYHCTTIVGCNTRKQHGLLVIPIPEMDDKAHVLLSSLDETVIQHGAPFNLGLHQYGDGVFAPNGHKYIRQFDCESVPTVTYRVGGVILTKEKVFISHENRILIKYTLLEAHSDTTLQFRPFLAFRNANDLCMENGAINTAVEPVRNGISTCLYQGYPNLFMQFSKQPEWVNDGHWYKGVEYYKDKDRGIPYKEDLWVPGYFQLPIKKGESIIFSASTEEADPDHFVETYEKELTTRTCRTSFYNCLKNSAKQFYLKNKYGMYIMAGYPWYNVRARDELMALPGCTLAIDHKEDYEAIMESFLRGLSSFLDTGKKTRLSERSTSPTSLCGQSGLFNNIDARLPPRNAARNTEKWSDGLSTKSAMGKCPTCILIPTDLCRPTVLTLPSLGCRPPSMAAQSFRARDIFWNSTRCGIMPLDSRYPSTTATQPCRIISTTSTPSQRP